jgi:DNA-directed RNA polymerase specialized sigma24 family protein
MARSKPIPALKPAQLPTLPLVFKEDDQMEDTIRGHLVPTSEIRSATIAAPRLDNFQLTDEDNALLLRISEPHRKILSMHGSYAQIGQELNMPLGTVRSRLHRARKALAQLRSEK